MQRAENRAAARITIEGAAYEERKEVTSDDMRVRCLFGLANFLDAENTGMPATRTPRVYVSNDLACAIALLDYNVRAGILFGLTYMGHRLEVDHMMDGHGWYVTYDRGQ